MGRAVLGLNRFLALVLGLVLIVMGVAMVAWAAGWLVKVWSAAPKTLTLKTATDAFTMAWWPWAAGIAGAIFILLAVWWLLAHLPRRGWGCCPCPVRARVGDCSSTLLVRRPRLRTCSPRLRVFVRPRVGCCVIVGSWWWR